MVQINELAIQLAKSEPAIFHSKPTNLLQDLQFYLQSTQPYASFSWNGYLLRDLASSLDAQIIQRILECEQESRCDDTLRNLGPNP